VDPDAPVLIAEKMRELGMKVLYPVLGVQYQPAQKDIEECKRLRKEIAVKAK
jgi:flavorubredoxin